MLVFTPHLNVGVWIFDLDFLYFRLKFFFPSLLLLRISLLVLRARHS
jgi:hypothetical protein